MSTVLSEGGLLIRSFEPADAGALYEAVRESIAELSEWLAWCHENYSLEESAEFIGSRGKAAEAGEWYSFGVFEADSGDFLGGVGLNFINRVHQMGNLGYWVRTSATGRGVASRAARLVARFGLEQAGLQRIEILAAVGNLPSQLVAEKAGALREAVLRKRLLVRGEPTDAVLFSLTAEDLV